MPQSSILVSNLHIYRKTLVNEFIREFNFLADVAASRATAKGDFTDKLLAVLKFVESGGLGNVPVPTMNIVSSVFELTVDWLNDKRKEGKHEHISEQQTEIEQEQLRILLETVALEASWRYEFVINAKLSDNPIEAIIPLAKAQVERMLEYITRNRLPLTKENLLKGIFEGHDGAFVNDIKNVRVKTKPGITGKFTAQGICARPAFMTPDGKYWLLDNKDKAKHKQTKQNNTTATALEKLGYKKESLFNYGYTKLVKQKDPNNKLKVPKYGYIAVPGTVVDYFGYELQDVATLSPTLLDEIKNNPPTIQIVTRQQIEDYLKNHKTTLSFNEYIKKINPHLEMTCYYPQTSQDSDLSQLDFSGADFSDCILNGIKLSGSLANTKWQNAYLIGADLTKVTDAKQANFSGAHLEFVKAADCNLAESDFTHAHCHYGDFTRTDLRKTQTLATVWIKAKLTGVKTDNLTELEQVRKKQEDDLKRQEKELQQQRREIQQISAEVKTLIGALAKVETELQKQQTVQTSSQQDVKACLQDLLAKQLTQETFERYIRQELVNLNQQLHDQQNSQNIEVQKIEQRIQILEQQLSLQQQHNPKQIDALQSSVDKLLTVISKVNKLEEEQTQQKITQDEFKKMLAELRSNFEVKPEFSSVLKKLHRRFMQSFDLRSFDLYIKPLGQDLQGNKSIDVFSGIHEFIQDEYKRSLLILGDSGMGKSMLLRWVATELWQRFFEKKSKIIPLFIHLPIIPEDKRKNNLLESFLKKAGLDIKEQAELKDYPLLLLLDGYDEITYIGNLYQPNGWENYNIKMMTTCRLEALFQRSSGFGYRKDFLTGLRQPLGQYESLTEITLKPFSADQIDAYLKMYIDDQLKHDKFSNIKYNYSQYRQMIEDVPGLSNLIEVPFILSMVIPVLPKMVEAQAKKQHEGRALTRLNLYNDFVGHWFDEQVSRWKRKGVLNELTGDLATYLRVYCENLAYQTLKKGKLETAIPEELTLDESLLMPKDPSRIPQYKNDRKNITRDTLIHIRSGCLLKTQTDDFSFLHKSLVEYFAASEMFIGAQLALDSYINSLENKSDTSRYCLNEQSLVTGAGAEKLVGLVQLLADRVRADKTFKELLYKVIELSKTQPLVATAAANAITILNVSGESFSGKNFKEIKIPGANLSGAICDGTDFTGANLMNVIFQHAWLQNANFTNANMHGAEFAELPSIENDHYITTMTMDPQNRWLLTGDMKGYLTRWDIKTRQKLSVWGVSAYATDVKLGGMLGFLPLTGLCISEDGGLVAVATFDAAVHIWDVEKGRCVKQLITGSTKIRSVAQGKRIRKMSFYKSQDQNYLVMLGNLTNRIAELQIWDVAAEQCILDMSENGAYSVWAFAVSPNARFLAYTNGDKQLIIGDLEQANFKDIISHKLDSTSFHITFSPNGRWLGVGTNSAIQLYETTTWQLVKSITFKNNTHFVFDPSSELIIVDSGRVLNVLHISSEKRLYDLAYPVTTGEGADVPYQGSITSHSFPSDNNNYNLQNNFIYHRSGNSVHHWSLLSLNNPLERRADLLNLAIVKKSISKQASTHEELLLTHEGLNASLTVKKGKGCLSIKNNLEPTKVFQFETKGDSNFAGELHNLVLSLNKRYIAFAYIDTYGYRSLQSLPIGLSTVKRLGPLMKDTQVQVWDLQEKKFLHTFSHHNQIIFMFFSKDENWLITAGYTVRIWDLKTGKCLHRYDEHKLWTEATALSDCKEYIAISDGSGAVGIWSTITHKRLCYIDNIDALMSEIEFSEDGNYLVGKDELNNQYQFCFDRKNNQLYLVNKLGQIKLSANRAIIKGASGLTEIQQILFKKKGAIGKPEAINIPSQFFQTSGKQESHCSIIDKSKSILPNQCVISIVRDKKSNIPNHAFLLLERINENGKIIMQRFDFFPNNENNLYGFVTMIPEKPLVCNAEEAENNFKVNCFKKHESAEMDNLIFQSWHINTTEASYLIADIQLSKGKKFNYGEGSDLLVKNSGPNFFITPKEQQAYNCFTWAVKSLHDLQNPNVIVSSTGWQIYNPTYVSPALGGGLGNG